ncbi:MAG: hypothetical protein H0A76_09120 [Candidatus Thiodubiliella endoseptemdiera]|uniref:Uncharacterized protein n=1 Tax=Candidatus Thiodubiliella endoseptemdiera TaxID=2738886 RepID=A0A853F3B9_9GAMM|nr:hypothetical protein [Candidatus Thiodubiliella endoseptemdiera]
MKLSDLISRSDVETLQELLGKTTVNLINQLEQQEFSTTKLKQVLQDMYSQTDLITNKNTRFILFDLLNETEVKDLFAFIKPRHWQRCLRQLKNKYNIKNKTIFMIILKLQTMKRGALNYLIRK